MKAEKLNVSELESGKTAETIKLIQEISNQVEKSKQQRLAARDADKTRIMKRIKNHPQNIPDEKYAPIVLPKTNIADVVTYVNERTLPELKKTITLLTTLITGPKPAPITSNHPDMHAIQKTISAVESKLKDVFDEEIFKHCFMALNSINLEQKANTWIQEMGSSFHNIQNIAISLTDAITKRAANPGLNLIQTAQSLEHISQKVRTITESIQQMQNNAFIQQFTSFTGIKSFLTSTFSTIREHQLPENPIAPAHHQTPGIESIILRIKSTYSTLAEKITHNKKLDDSVSATTNSLIKLMNDAKDFYTDPLASPSTFTLIKYAYNHLNVLMQLFNHASRSINILKAISKDFYLSVAQNINLLIKDLFLIIDKLELTFYLKEGFLLNQKLLGHYSLRDLGRQFNDSIDNQGYEFPQTERFPYTESIQAQRNQLASSATILFEKEFIQKRIAKTQKQISFGQGVKNLNKHKALHYQKINIKNHITHLLTQRMNELTAEIAASTIASSSKLAKKELLTQLQACYNKKDQQKLHLERELSKTGEEYIDEIINYPGVLTHIHYLFEGRTGKFIKELQNCKTTRHDILLKIDSEIESLKQQRDETYYYSTASRKTLVEDKIFALEQFRLSIAKAGYTFDDALNELKINNLISHDILFYQANELLHDLRQMDQHITPLLRGKKTIGLIHNTNNYAEPLSTTTASLKTPPMDHLDHKHMPKLHLTMNNTPTPSISITQEIDTTVTSVISPMQSMLAKTNTPAPTADQFSIDLIKIRIADLKAAFIITNTKQIKIDLLTHLTNNLATMPLTQAIQAVRNQRKFKMNFYLLFEGRTGEMMKTMQHSKLSKDDMAHRIRLAIIRLKSLRTQSLYFFAQSRKQKQEKCIKALYAYKEAILNNKTSEYSLSLISPEYQDILKDNERSLLVDIHHWEKTQNKNHYTPAR
jgi:hypothetical protein